MTPIPEEDRQEILESAAKIGQQVARCKVITQGMLKFSRKVESRPEKLDLNQLLEELTTMARSRAKVENVNLQTDLGELPLLFGSPANLQQIFVNLVNNAIDATAGRSDGTVVIRSRYGDSRIKVEIADSGCGIAPENLSNIFLPFFTTKSVGKGTGLGLAICYGLVQDMGGTMQVESTVGVGTTFRVELPRESPEAGAPPACIERNPMSPIGVLLVDDEEEFTAGLSKVFDAVVRSGGGGRCRFSCFA